MPSESPACASTGASPGARCRPFAYEGQAELAGPVAAALARAQGSALNALALGLFALTVFGAGIARRRRQFPPPAPHRTV